MRIWRTFAGVCWTGKRFDFDGGAQEVLGRGRNPPVTASPCQPPLGKGTEGTGGADCHSQCAHWLRNDRFLQGVQWAGDRKGRPCGSVTWSAWRRDDVGSELSAAGGRRSEVSEWPRSKFPASAVRQRRNFGHRNRDIRPPVPLAPLPKGGCHGEAVTGGFLTSPHLLQRFRRGRCPHRPASCTTCNPP